MTANASTTNVSATSTPSGKNSETSSAPTALQIMGEEQILLPRVLKRENVRQKGARLLVSGRLRVVKVDGNLIVAECRGDSGEVYSLGHEPGSPKPWRCTCAAVGPCSHLHALWAVTAVER